MTTKARAGATPAADEKPVDLDDVQADDVDQAPEETKAQKMARLRAELDELARNDAGVIPPEPTHVLLLANGKTVESANPGATHHTTEEGGVSYPVINRFELPREEA
jgi:hypothetical protein